MKILIIGGMGVIGGAITKAAAMKNYNVFVVSRRTLSPDWENLGVKGISGNWKNDEFANNTAKMGFDVIVDTQVFDKKQLIRSMNIADGHCRQYIYISTDSVYKHPAICLKEDDEIDSKDIYWEYGKKKRDAELYLINVGDKYKFEWTCIRPTLTFGETRIPVGYASKRNTYTLVERIISGKPILRFDEANSRHAVCHTSIFGNAAIGLFLNEKAYGQFFHISDDYAFTYDEIFAAIEKIVGTKGFYVKVPTECVKKYNRSVFEEMVYDKNPDFVLDNSKIKSVAPDVNYHANIETVMRSTLTYIENHSIGVDDEYNLITDNILLDQFDNIEDKLIKQKIQQYISTIPKEYKIELRKFKRKKRIDNLLYPLKKCKRHIKEKFLDK